MNDIYTLDDLGWSSELARQLTTDDQPAAPARITAVHRNRAEALTEAGPAMLIPPPDLSMGEIAVGDWVLTDGLQLRRVLERRSLLARRAAGHAVEFQLIAANIDTLLIVTSCNNDFNPARLERYLALAANAGIEPVIVLTKPDLAEDTKAYVSEAEALSPGLAVVLLNAKGDEVQPTLSPWCRKGQTVAMLGSSGVGKTTIANALTGGNLATAGIREDDAKGRHTTTGRNMMALPGGGWLIDTPGMREIQMADTSEGIDTLFDDLSELAAQCRFNDCRHETEPGCAIRAAMKAGEFDIDRLNRWKKLQREDRMNSETLAQSRQRSKAFTKMVHKTVRTKLRTRDNFD